MNGILDGLNPEITPVAPPVPSPEPTESNIPDDAVQRVSLVVRALASGQVPAAWVPKGTIEGGMEPDAITKQAGLNIYHPRVQTHIQGVVFNPLAVNKAELSHLDKQEKLDAVFPNLVNLLSGGGAPSEGGETSSAVGEAPADRIPVTPTVVRGSNAIAAGPRPALNLPEPSRRIRPGGGSVLNGLLAQPV